MAFKRIDPMIRMIVGRCHVGSDYLTVIRHVISSLTARYAGFRAMAPETRRAFLSQIIACHKANRQLYGYVMSGNHSPCNSRNKLSTKLFGAPAPATSA